MHLSIPMYTYVHNFIFQFINTSSMILSNTSDQFSMHFMKKFLRRLLSESLLQPAL